MSPAESFDDVIGRLRAGDQDAAAEVFRRFASRLIALARTRLDTQMRRKVDPESVAQSVFRSFFLRQANGQFELDDWNSLWSLLVRITLRKCGRRIAAFHAECRDVRREVAAAPMDQESRLPWEAIAREPTPEEAASLTETLEYLMGRLDEKQQQVVVLRLQGYTVGEIGRQVGRTERTVHRVLGLVRDGLRRMEARASG
jgi:RNA polymerase sigma-70 factor (ECF subfamily)